MKGLLGAPMLRRLPLFAPGLFLTILGIWWNLSHTNNPILYLRFQLSVGIFILGLLLLFLAAVIIAFTYRIELVRLDTILEAADDRRRFLRRLDHELKNPLTAILAGLANLGTQDSASRIDHKTLESVENQVRRLSRLVADLRKLSELETRELEYTQVDMNEVIESAVALAKSQEKTAFRVVNISIPRAPWPLPSISGDRDLLFLAVHNILDNALKFSRPGDTIEIRAHEDGANVIIEVADTGPGIAAEDLPHVWEELYRGEVARGIPGSGLGLALVQAIILRHNGQVNLRSRPEQGTIVTLRIPIGDLGKR
jgi:two-component system OmpR family sensor kinase